MNMITSVCVAVLLLEFSLLFDKPRQRLDTLYDVYNFYTICKYYNIQQNLRETERG